MGFERRRQYPLFIVLSCLYLLLMACSKPTLEALPQDAIILAFGDSLTAGVGATSEQSYPSVLAQMSSRKVINAGVSGETTEQGLQRLPTVLDEANPDLVILIEGGNDILKNINYDAIKSNLSEMIQLIQARNIPVILLGIPEKKLFSNTAPFYESLAQQHEVILDGELIARLLKTPSLKSDPIHLNDDGYRKMAQGIHDLLSRHGAL